MIEWGDVVRVGKTTEVEVNELRLNISRRDEGASMLAGSLVEDGQVLSNIHVTMPMDEAYKSAHVNNPEYQKVLTNKKKDHFNSTLDKLKEAPHAVRAKVRQQQVGAVLRREVGLCLKSKAPYLSHLICTRP